MSELLFDRQVAIDNAIESLYSSGETDKAKSAQLRCIHEIPSLFRLGEPTQASIDAQLAIMKELGCL
jgi:hypothetical protein